MLASCILHRTHIITAGMHSRTIFKAAALSSVAFAQVDLPISSEDAAGLASLIQEAIPTEYQDLVPSVSLTMSKMIVSGATDINC